MILRPSRAAAAGLFTLATMLAGCGEDLIGPADPITRLPRALSAAEVEIIAAGNTFARDLLGQVHAAAPDSTVFLSPLSVSMALGMTMNGAGGETRSQMHEMLGFGGLSMQEVNASYRDLMALLGTLDPRVEIGIANAAFHRNDFTMKPVFVQTLDDYFDAHVEALDFANPAATETMNAWVRAQTANRIDNVVEPPIDPNLLLFLMNAVYFNGDWTTSFDPEESYDGPFSGPAGAATVRYMTKEDSIGYRTTDTWEAVELPYGGGAFSMVLALPRSANDLADVVADMDDLLDAEADWPQTSVTLHMPKIELEWERLLNDDLEALGMEYAFDDRADFSGITEDIDLVVHFVKQNTFLSVDEVGTEAAAVTVVGIGPTCACGPPEFRADRPFFMAIRERLSGAVLFAGLIVEPPL